jgi:hypothetical protein
MNDNLPAETKGSKAATKCSAQAGRNWSSRYANGVGKLQPRVCFETLGIERTIYLVATLKELRPGFPGKHRCNSFIGLLRDLRVTSGEVAEKNIHHGDTENTEKLFPDRLFQSCVFEKSTCFPRVARAQPWAAISERFQR